MNIVAHTMPWYTALLQRPPDFIPDASVCEWQLYANCWLALVQARPDPGRNRIRFGVADLRGEAARIQAALAIAVSPPNVLEGLVAWCDFEDPWGNRLGLFQDLADYPW